MTVNHLSSNERKNILKRLFFVFFLLFILLTGCNNQAEVEPESDSETEEKLEQPADPISEEEANSLEIANYFPNEPGTIREYEMYDENGEVMIKDYEVVNSFGSTEFLSPEELGEFVILRSSEIYDPVPSVRESSDSYELKDNKLIRLAGGTDSESEASTEDEVLLTNTVSWEMAAGTTRTITALDKTIQTAAGEFTDCIETTDTSSEDDTYQVKTYFAPEKGLVLEQSYSEEADTYNTRKEMINFELPDEEDGSAYEEDPGTEKKNDYGETFEYYNEAYGFYLDLPVQWRDHYLVEETENEGDQIINFRFKSGDDLYIDTIVYMVITDKTEEQINAENEVSGFPLIYLDTQEGKSYGYLYNVGDPSIELINSEEDLNLLIEFKQNVPEVMETLRFEP